ncbi:metallophosphoesterase family protein [Tritonibacter scottomollicae]|uniref:metallophosphoesterase family protein n=1 Tax=Tritonibacter scottomollicae TaxID=483013 RepID=UPI003AA7EDBD
MTKPIYAIGDIHGQTAQLDRALELIAADGGPEAEVVFVGDYVDRGPDSRGVIARLMQGQAEGRNWTCLKGNHDRMFEWFMEDTPRHDPHLLVGYHWFHERIGGVATLGSYGLEVPDRIRLEDLHRQAKATVPEDHVAFLRNLSLSHLSGDLLFVHAGVRPGTALADQAENDLVWIRDGFLDHAAPHPWLVVHGHTAEQHPVHYGNRVDIDCGAGYGRALVPVVFEGTQAWCLTDEGRQRLLPEG